jgi:uncharacterized membrane protein
MKIRLDTILLFALLIPFIMTYRIGPGETPYWLFGFIFLGLFTYTILDLSLINIKEKIVDRSKYVLLWALIVLSVGSGFYSSIMVRRQTSPVYGVHDIIIQQESAIRFLLHGQNPYSANYFETPLKDWGYSTTETNPALYHFVMQPIFLIFAIPFYLLSAHVLFGFFDARIPLFFLFFVLLFLASRVVNDPERKRTFMALLAFNPATLGYLLEGRDDIFMFAFAFSAFYFLTKGKNLIAGVLMALAFATKQSIWPIFPFYFAYLFFKNKDLKRTIIDLIPFAIVFSIIVLPFFLWDPQDFINSTILYLSGNAKNSYPVSGYGIGSLLIDLGVIKDKFAYYPFLIWQTVFALPLMIWFILWQKKENTVKKLILTYALFLFVFWYLSRYFNNSHLGYISMVLITAYFWPQENRSKGN